MSKIEIGIKFKKVNDDDTWIEKYNVDEDTDIELYAEEMIGRFNATLKEHEVAREVVSVKIIGNVQPEFIGISNSDKRILSQIESLLNDLNEHNIVCTIIANGFMCFHDYTVNYEAFKYEEEFIDYVSSYGGFVQSDMDFRSS